MKITSKTKNTRFFFKRLHFYQTFFFSSDRNIALSLKQVITGRFVYQYWK